MGGTPQDAFISLAVPADVAVEELDQLYDGMKELARRSRVNLLGGDTTGSRQDLCVNVVVTGSVPVEQVLYRSGARPGDRILVTGTLGDSGAACASARAPRAAERGGGAAAGGPLHPELYLEEARLFAASGFTHGAIDLSDGLASDLRHVCKQSRVGRWSTSKRSR